jgi:hypothetical protein
MEPHSIEWGWGFPPGQKKGKFQFCFCPALDLSPFPFLNSKQGCSLDLTQPHSSTLLTGKHPISSNETNIQHDNLVITFTPQKDKYSHVIWS